MNTAKYTEDQFTLIELLLNSVTCPDETVHEAMKKAEDFAVKMNPEDILIAQNAMLRIIRRQPD
jgi:hypothetical protein